MSTDEYMNVMSVCVPPKLMCWILTLKVMVVEGGAFGSWVGHEEGGFMNEISALIKQA